jgi:octaprenyl-diphosphate synthase
MDNGVLRRARPTLWRQEGPSVAILVGDLLLCEAMGILADTERGRYVSTFVSKVREVCAAEAEHEISLRGKRLDRSTCLRLARGKTGPLFAFVGVVSGGDDADLSAALDEAGYRIGTAYQVFDDLVDIVGDEGEAKKTLGTDAVRRKFTMPQSTDGQEAAIDCVKRLCRSAVERVSGWARVRTGIETYLEHDLGPVFDRLCGPRFLCGD